jgi:hypothetical protein
MKYLMKAISIRWLFFVVLFASACSGSPTDNKNLSKPAVAYLKTVREPVDAVWTEQLRRSFQRLSPKERTVHTSKLLATKAVIEVDEQGVVKRTKLLQASGDSFFDTVCQDTLKHIPKLPAPYPDILSGNRFQFSWEFVFDPSR